MTRELQNLSLAIIGLLLLGYLVADKGFAHIGIHPLYISEIALAIILVLFSMAPDGRVFHEAGPAWAILALDFYCLFQTIPFIGQYGADALRDGVIYGYSIFAFIIGSTLRDAWRIERLCVMYGKTVPLCIILMPFLLLIQPMAWDPLSNGTPLLALKPGDAAVHAAGLLSFELLGLGALVRQVYGGSGPAFRWLVWGALAFTVVWTASLSRGGLLTILSVLGLLAAFGCHRRAVIGVVAAGAVLLGALMSLDIRVERSGRDVSSTPIVKNVGSIVSVGLGAPRSGAGNLMANAAWRLSWWGDIVDYTVFGDYFWAGKGFGVNLASDDGRQVESDESLRSPHNATMTILARAGVPGLALWLGFLASFALTLARLVLRMRERRLVVWERINLWILSYWTASLVNGSFDVYLEGPQGGIWFWSISGAGMAVMALERRALSHALPPAEARAFQPESFAMSPSISRQT